MPWNPELINTKVSIYRPDQTGPGGDDTGGLTTVASLIPGYVEPRDQAVRRATPVPTSAIGKRVDLWIEGVDAAGAILGIEEDDLIEWLEPGGATSKRWEIDTIKSYPGPMSGGLPTLDHVKIEARP